MSRKTSAVQAGRRARRLEICLLVLACLGLAALSMHVRAALAQEDALRAALSRAYETSPRLVEAQERLRQANEERPVALGNWLPSVTARGGIGRQRESFRNFDENPEETTRLRDIELEASINIYRGGGGVAELRAAENRIRAERARYVSTEQVVLFDAAQAYCDVFRDQAVVEAREANVEYLRRVVEVTREFYDLGDRTEGDLAQATGRLAEARSDLAFARASLEGSRASYVRAVGEAPIAIRPPSLPPGLPASEDDVLGEASQVNPDVVASDFAARAARNDISIATSQLLPSVDLQGLADYTRDDLRLGTDRRVVTYAVRAALTVPLYQRGIEYARVRQAKAAARERDAAIDTVRRDVIEQALRAWSDVQAAVDRIQALRQAVRANEQAVASVAAEVRVGRRALLDLLDVQRDLVNTQVNLASTQRDQVVAAYAVLGGIGRLTAWDLQLPVAYYDWEADYQKTRWRLFGLD